MDLSKYRQLYVTETQDILETLARTILELESTPQSPERLNTAFRLFHSVKGMSGTMGFTPVFDLAHQLEELMDHVRRGQLDVRAGTVDVLRAGVDRLSSWVADVDVGQEPAQDRRAAQLHARIGSLISQSAPPPPAPFDEPMGGQLEYAPGDLVVQALPAPVAGGLDVRGYLLCARLAALGEVIDTVPPREALRAGRLNGPLRIALRTAHPQKVVRGFIELSPDWTEVSVSDGEAASTLEESLFFTGELEPMGPAVTERESAAIVREPRAARTIRVRAEWLDEQLERIGALVSLAHGLEDDLPASAEATITEMRRLLTELEAEGLSVRRVPLSVLTDRLAWSVRDLARQVGKRAVLRVEGADQPLDRALIEGIDPALTHLVRNAVQHGLEEPAERLRRGKAGRGRVSLRCRRVRDEIVIELADDGAGIDPAQLVERATALGLMSRAEAHRAARSDLIRLLSLPGLTTRDAANSLSGRGMGMDAVVEAISSLGGSIVVRTRVGRGTLFRLRLPVSRGLARLAEVKVGEQRFVVPAARVEQMLSRADVAAEGGQRWVTWEDRRWPALDLAAVLGIPSAVPPTAALLVRDPPRALLVNSVAVHGAAVIQPLPPPLERTGNFLGAILPPAGPPLLVLDPSSVAAGYRSDA